MNFELNHFCSQRAIYLKPDIKQIYFSEDEQFLIANNYNGFPFLNVEGVFASFSTYFTNQGPMNT
jgi:hypothetical protein